MMSEIKPGDTITLADCYRAVPNSARRWWQFWKPRLVASEELAVFTVAAHNETGTTS